MDRLLRAGGMFLRNGSGALGLCHVACGRLLGYVEPHINSWDCLGAVGVLNAAGARVSDFLAGDGLLRGNPIVAGPPRRTTSSSPFWGRRTSSPEKAEVCPSSIRSREEELNGQASRASG